jgi:hypothetical protein
MTYPVIASRRFFEFATRHNLPLVWRPVHLVD